VILERLLAPMGLETFFAEHHDRAPFHLKGVSDFRDWLSFDALDRIIATQGLRHPQFRLARDSQIVPPGQYAIPSLSWGHGSVRDFAKPDSVFKLMADGITIVMDDCELLHPPLAEVSRQLQLELVANVPVHVFCTPAGTQAFRPHFDIHNVFLVQFEGSKYWRIHEHAIDRPLRTQPCDPNGCPAGELLFEGLVEAGDVLYIPRGTVHYAEARDEPSLHGSFSSTPFSWQEVLRNALKNFDDPWLDQPVDVDWRGEIPLSDEDDEAFDEMLERFAESDGAASAFDRLARVWLKRRLPLGAQLRDAEVRLDATTQLRRRPGIVHRIEGSTVMFTRFEVDLGAHAPVVAASTPFAAGTLGVELATELLNKGLLEVVS